MNSDKIIEVFSFAESERSTYPFLDDYERRIRSIVHNAICWPASRDRYCLVGLYVTYRAFHHWGLPFDTLTDPDDIPEPFRSRIEVFRLCTGREVRSDFEYIRLLGIGWRFILGPLGTLGLGRAFARYVQKKSSPWVS